MGAGHIYHYDSIFSSLTYFVLSLAFQDSGDQVQCLSHPSLSVYYIKKEAGDITAKPLENLTQINETDYWWSKTPTE